MRQLPTLTFNYLFEMDNRNKRSLAVDLRYQEGKEVVHKLVEKSDIFVSNFEASAVRKLHMDYETLSRINPRIIYSLATGFGDRGPDRDLKAFDYIAWARSGIMGTMGQEGTPPPQCLPAFGDHITAITQAYGIMLALFHRERTGIGQEVKVSLLGSLIETAGLSFQSHLVTGHDIPRASRESELNPLWNAYQTKDGRWMQLAMLQTDVHWRDFCQAMGIEELQNDPRFNAHIMRTENNESLISILDEVFLTKTASEWAERFRERNLIWTKVQTWREVAADPQTCENGYIIDFDHPSAGSIKMVGHPVKLSKTPGEIRAPAPEFGQHDEEIVLELGYTWEEIGKLREQKVIV